MSTRPGRAIRPSAPIRRGSVRASAAPGPTATIVPSLTAMSALPEPTTSAPLMRMSRRVLVTVFPFRCEEQVEGRHPDAHPVGDLFDDD